MKITYTPSDITYDSGSYFSPAFVTSDVSDLLTIECILSSDGTVMMQQSINGVNWYDVDNSSFSCTPKGLESYAQCKSGLLYRAKCSSSVTSIYIVI